MSGDEARLRKAEAAVSALTGEVMQLKYELKQCQSERNKLLKKPNVAKRQDGKGNKDRDSALQILADVEKENEELQTKVDFMQKKIQALEASQRVHQTNNLQTIGLSDGPPVPAQEDFGFDPVGSDSSTDQVISTLSRQLERAQSNKSKLEERVHFLEETLNLTNSTVSELKERNKQLENAVTKRTELRKEVAREALGDRVPDIPPPTDTSSGGPSVNEWQMHRMAMAKLENVLEEKTLEALQLKESLLTHTSQRTQMRRLITRAKDRLRFQESKIKTLTQEKLLLEQALNRLKKEATQEILNYKRKLSAAEKETASIRQFYAKNAQNGLRGVPDSSGSFRTPPRKQGVVGFGASGKTKVDLHDWGSPAANIRDEDRQQSLGGWLGTAISSVSSATTALVNLVDEESKRRVSRQTSAPPTLLHKGVSEARHNPFAAFMSQQSEPCKKIRALPGNKLCADCGSDKPTWAVTNIGVVVCLQCSGCHRDLGVNVSKVKSLNLDRWDESTLQQMLARNGNATVNSQYEGNLRPGLKPNPTSTRPVRRQFIAMKYEEKAFYTEPMPEPTGSERHSAPKPELAHSSMTSKSNAKRKEVAQNDTKCLEDLAKRSTNATSSSEVDKEPTILPIPLTPSPTLLPSNSVGISAPHSAKNAIPEIPDIPGAISDVFDAAKRGEVTEDASEPTTSSNNSSNVNDIDALKGLMSATEKKRTSHFNSKDECEGDSLDTLRSSHKFTENDGPSNSGAAGDSAMHNITNITGLMMDVNVEEEDDELP